MIGILALVGAPIAGAFMGWRVFTRYESGECERASVAIMVAVAVFSGWLGLCDKLLKALS